MKVQKDILLQSLDFAKLAVAKKGEVEQLTHFIFTGNEIVTFNNRMAVFLDFETPFSCSVKAELFYKQLSKFTSAEIDIDLVKGKLVLKGKGERASFSIISSKDDEVSKILHSIQNDHADCEHLPVPNNFGEGVSFASFSASKTARAGVLCSVMVDGKHIYSTDNYRATQFTMETEISHKLLIQREVAANFSNFDIREYSVGDHWMSFYCDNGVTFSTRLIHGDYPNFKNAFEMEEWEEVEFPDTITAAIDFVSIITAKDDRIQRIGHVHLDKGDVTISADRTTESSEKAVPLVNSTVKEPLEFAINLEFFKTILRYTHKLNYNMETQRAMFSNDNFKHIIRMAI